MAPRKGERRPNTREYEKRFIAGEWNTLTELVDYLKKHKIKSPSESTIRCHAADQRWIERRTDIELKSNEQAAELIVQDNAQDIKNMVMEQLQIARALRVKAANYLLGKVVNSKGKLVEREFGGEGMALAALRLGASMEQALLLRRRDEPQGGMLFTGPNLIVGGPLPDPTQMRSYSPAELQAILDQPDDPTASTQKAGGRGASSAAAGPGKRR